ncbi:IS3 family transposase [Gordonia polyisoprenivorans]|uniref:IS3 family transposase n=1 Tax=Gordonia polyisoprenivorans TaxID=84595 RepID=UPI001AD6196E|nr:IS3 family transposase [Gordonia polyisoprenivorans]QTI71294.1 IS3 family transposase [Gordonia polyisoprenivorans]
MLGEIRTVHADNLGVYGARKVHAELCGKGFGVARCTVDRLMKADGLHLELADTAPTTTRAHLTGLRIHSVLNRELNASASEVAEYIE